ncbi:MAG: VCBS repeat-containing protein [SAR324 cluster bacterium]|nr:VCBS repeat-containing protein [SAR324 cluster bacterium]
MIESIFPKNHKLLLSQAIRNFLPSWQIGQVKIFLFSLPLVLGCTFLHAQEQAQDAKDNATQATIAYEWERIYYGKMNNELQLLYTRAFARSRMAFMDIDGDGDDDLMIGKEDGQLAFLENIGKPGEPDFYLRTEAFQAFHSQTGADGNTKNVESAINVGANAAPTFVDIDGDGDYDLFIGSQDGSIFYYHNKGNALLPIYELKNPAYMGLRPGKNIVPSFQDINMDRVPDLLVGTHSGKVYLYKNAGRQTNALFCSSFRSNQTQNQRPCPYPRELVGDTFPEVDASPTWVDWNYDGLWDIAIGKASGQISFYYNKGNAFQPKWEMETDRFLFIDVGGYASPIFYDFDNDGFTELLVGTSTSKIIHYENREVLQNGLRKITELNLSNINWKENHLRILERACQQLQGDPACLPVLARAFNIPDDIPQELKQYADFVVKVKSKSSQADDAEPDNNPEQAEPVQEAAPPQQASIRSFNRQLLAAQANAPDPAANQEQNVDAEAAATEQKKEKTGSVFPMDMANRNHLWLSSRNFLKFGHFLNGEQRSVITTGDWDGDGDLDLLVGGESGKLFAYENIGTTRTPNWRSIENPAFSQNQRSNSAPALADIDGDGDLDILVGNQAGKLDFIKNHGSPVKPEWKIEELAFANIDVGSNSIPVLIDIDNDKDLDLFVGNSKGRMIFYLNEGSDKQHQFVIKSTQFANLVEETNIAPAFFFWDDDEAPDLVVGGKNGTLHLISNNHLEGTPLTHGWNLEEHNWSNIETAGFSVPHVTDFDKDQKLDLLVGDIDGNVLIWLNRGSKKVEPEETNKPAVISNSIERTDENALQQGEDTVELDPIALEEELQQKEVDLPFAPVYTLITKQYINLANSRRLVPAFFDMDVDGDLDLLIGTKEGFLFQYMNEGTVAEPNWTLISKRFLEYNNGENATPVFGDVDQDGDADLLVGNARGTLEYWENQGTVDFPEFIKNPTVFQGITGGVHSRPALIDINQDGLLDLLIGNFKGQLVHYLQSSTDTGRSFQLIHRRYLGLDLGIGASPTAADLNNDKNQELIIGSDHGDIIGFQPVPIEQDPTRWGWKQDSSYFEKLRKEFPLGNAPAFADIDQDGDVDMFVGGEDGSLYYYRNDGKPGAK